MLSFRCGTQCVSWDASRSIAADDELDAQAIRPTGTLHHVRRRCFSYAEVHQVRVRSGRIANAPRTSALRQLLKLALDALKVASRI